jgi:hypothetical protein
MTDRTVAVARSLPCCLVVAAVLGVAPRAVSADNQSKIITALRSAGAPRIDGHLDDAAWSTAPVDDQFTQNFPDEHRAPTERTELRIVFDDHSLYFGIRCWDTHPEAIIRRVTRRDRETDADKVQIDIDASGDHRTAYHFEVNVSGMQVDGIRFNDTDFKTDWDEAWAAATSEDGQGWSAEIEIPLAILRYDGQATSLGLQVRRLIPRRLETDEWAYIPRTAGAEVSYYGKLAGRVDLRSARLFEVSPYATGRLLMRSNQRPLDGVHPTASVGADLKLGLTPALTLQATVNPDFGQVEADQVVLNLTTFETFYPEKRPFFAEGADIFETPFTQFYSRRIGNTPDAPALGANELVLDPITAANILGATKLIGSLLPHLSIGALDAVTSGVDVPVGLDNGSRREVPLSPITNFAALRLRQDLGVSSSVGVTGTSVNRFEPAAPVDSQTGLCPDGTSPSTGRCTHDAYTGGVDLNLKTADGQWGIISHTVVSHLAGGPAFDLLDGTRVGPDSTGLGVSVEAGKYGGAHWLTKISYLGASPRLTLDDAGYLAQSNLHEVNAMVMYRSTEPVGPLRETEIHVGERYDRSWDGATLWRDVQLGWWIRWNNFWESYAQCAYDWDHYDNRETHDGAWMERVGSTGCYGKLWTDPRSWVKLYLNAAVYRTLRGQALSFAGGLHLQPISRLDLELLPNASRTTGDPRWFYTQPAQGDMGPVYAFADLESHEFDLTVRGTYAFSPRLSLDLYSQIFLASGRYGRTLTATPAPSEHPVIPLASLAPSSVPDGAASPDFRDGVINLNLILRWEYRPGSVVMLLYVHQHNQIAFDPIMESATGLRFDRFGGGAYIDIVQAKATYLF